MQDVNNSSKLAILNSTLLFLSLQDAEGIISMLERLAITYYGSEECQEDSKDTRAIMLAQIFDLKNFIYAIGLEHNFLDQMFIPTNVETQTQIDFVWKMKEKLAEKAA